MALQKTRKGFLDTEEGKEFKRQLKLMKSNDAYNTSPSYSADNMHYPDNLIPFVDKHMIYLINHPALEARRLPVRPGRFDRVGHRGVVPPRGRSEPMTTMQTDTVTVTIDGYQITVPKGTLVIRAAEMIGVTIPRFCDHPLLDPIGACRQCLVDIEGQRKPLASCTTVCTDGMVVKTQYSSPVAEKAQRALAVGITPVVCVGETLQEREAGQTEAVVKRQLAAVIHLNGHCISEVVVAYEPVWAIGTGRTASPEQAQAVHAVLRAQLAAASEHADRIRLLYGGSMNAGNAAQLLAQPDIDGGLVGGASLKAKDFLQIIAAAR